jgi:putative nucleotidyltransferase with HDIG domain
MYSFAASFGRNSRAVRWVAIATAVGGLIVCTVIAVLQAPLDHSGKSGIPIVLAVAAIVGGTLVVGMGSADVSAAFIVVILAIVLVGPLFACAAAVLSEVAASRRVHTRRVAFAGNLFATVAPALLAANLVHWLHPGKPTNTVSFYLSVLAAGVLYIGLNFSVAAAYLAAVFERNVLEAKTLWRLLPSLALTLILAVAGVGIYLKLGLAGISFALTAVFAFSYMAQLVERARHRSEQYVSLSWGVLAGLMRSMDIRDGRIARHSAAVARFARDIAAQVGMGEAEQELAHTAGLLHDIGHFALSDRVAERGRTLTDEDWVAIHRHPELGADMLKDLGMYGPVAEIVLAHHERIDGRGYPNELTADEIPEIAKIIAVAEVYDTLTASDTYRTRMSSFEALTELRRVSGTQLDGRYVELLAGLLTGVGVDYRHADTADFDTELDMERRINEAGAGR